MPVADKGAVYYCEKCGKTLTAPNFYISNNLEKYPSGGRLLQCKQCITMHVNNWDPKTFLWILQEIDVPYVPEEWNRLLLKYGNDPKKVRGSTILGRYLSKMKLVQYKNYRWADTEHLHAVQQKKVQETMEKQGYTQAQIDEVLEKATMTLNSALLERPPEVNIPLNLRAMDSTAIAEHLAAEAYKKEEIEGRKNMNGSSFINQAEIDAFRGDYGAIEPTLNPYEEEITAELTEEDKKYLSLKWGYTYSPAEWVALEQLYNEMMESYDIQSAGHIDILKKCCKTSLKADQLLAIADIEGAQKMIRMYDMLMKAGKFTAAQNKAESGEAVDSLSELFAMCEADGFIPRYYTDGPQDKADRVLQDMQGYLKNLVVNELNLGNLIEIAAKQIESDKAKEAESEADAAGDDDLFEDELFAEKDTNTLTPESLTEFNDWMDEEGQEDLTLQKKLEAGEL